MDLQLGGKRALVTAGMRARGWGRVVQISSVLGQLPKAIQFHYAATGVAKPCV